MKKNTRNFAKEKGIYQLEKETYKIFPFTEFKFKENDEPISSIPHSKTIVEKNDTKKNIQKPMKFENSIDKTEKMELKKSIYS